LVDGKSTRIAEAIVLRHLVEGFSRRIVDRRTQHRNAVEIVGAADDRVASRHEEAQKRIVDGLYELRRIQVREHVVYALKREIA
jgi:hypothetical protein